MNIVFKKLLGGVAPTIGKALGGSLGGAAMTELANALGCKPEKDDVQKILQHITPEQLLAVKEAEIKFAEMIAQLDIDLAALAEESTNNARLRFSKDWTARAIALVSLFMFGGYIFLVTTNPPSDGADPIVTLVLGYLGGIVSSVVSFYFGASHKHDDKV